jgi:hypothetical protein
LPVDVDPDPGPEPGEPGGLLQGFISPGRFTGMPHRYFDLSHHTGGAVGKPAILTYFEHLGHSITPRLEFIRWLGALAVNEFAKQFYHQRVEVACGFVVNIPIGNEIAD